VSRAFDQFLRYEGESRAPAEGSYEREAFEIAQPRTLTVRWLTTVSLDGRRRDVSDEELRKLVENALLVKAPGVNFRRDWRQFNILNKTDRRKRFRLARGERREWDEFEANWDAAAREFKERDDRSEAAA